MSTLMTRFKSESTFPEHCWLFATAIVHAQSTMKNLKPCLLMPAIFGVNGRLLMECITMRSGSIVTQTREEFWRVLGSDEALLYDEGLIQRPFDEVTHLLTTLIAASLEFVKSV